MYLSIAIIIYLLLMAILWSTQGLFSSFIHLVVVIVAGVLAFSFWELVAVSLIMPWAPHMAWGVGLLVPFTVLVLAIRVLTDTVVPSNVKMPGIVDTILGGAVGVVSGTLTAGVVIIGLGFLPLDAELLGYQPYAYNADGTVTQTDQELWVEADRYADDFFQTLSAGAMSSGRPMALYQPGLREQSGLYRLRYDPNASLVATPGTVEVERLVVSALPVEGVPAGVVGVLPGLEEGQQQQLVLVDLKVTKGSGTFDRDATLRMPPTQVRLLAGQRGVRESSYVAPIAFARLENPETGERVLYPVTDDRISADSALPDQNLTWAFVIGERDVAKYLMVRNLRLDLPQQEDGPEQLAGLLGLPKVEAVVESVDAINTGSAEAGNRTGVRAGHAADIAEVTNRLPRAISRNNSAGLTMTSDGDETFVQSGESEVARPSVSLSGRSRVDAFYLPDHLGMVRVLLEEDQAVSILGRARASAASLQGVWIKDDRGNIFQPFAYVLLKGDGTQLIKADPEFPIRSARQLPLNQLGDDDELYLYFQVAKGTRIATYHIGNSTTQDLDLLVE
ncbi:MAG: CvpA family protein [Phycisphaeraceae bacterium]